MNRRFILLVCLLLLDNLKAGFAQEEANDAKLPTLKIDVLKEDWGKGDLSNIQAVCVSAGSELIKYFPGLILDPITLSNDSKAGPMVIYGKGKAGERRVLLNTKDTFWSQYAFQFGHELCHILCNYRAAKNPQLWFEESLCETASLFVLKQMGKTWQTKPPYSNWKSYGTSLEGYAEDRIRKTAKPTEKAFAEWYRNNEAGLQKTGTNRELNQVVAVNVLLPLLEKEPKHWQAVNFLNQWDRTKTLTFREYLEDWQQRVPKERKAFVLEVAKQFDVKLEP